MQQYDKMLDELGGPPKYGEEKNWLAVESRKYNRRLYVLARRSLPRTQREAFDFVVRFALSRSIAVWSGSLTLDYADLAELVQSGRIRLPEG